MGMAWPVEYGGRGLSPIYDAILNEEAGRSSSPPIPGMVNYLGRAIYTYGTRGAEDPVPPHPAERGRRPGARASASPRPGRTWRRCGPGPTSTATSTWSTARRCGPAAASTPTGASCWRGPTGTCPSTRASRACSSTCTPRGSRPPIVLADGDPETCEVFWDNVAGAGVPAAWAQPGLGWRVAMTTVTYERGPADIGFIATYKKSLRAVEALAVEKGVADDPERAPRPGQGLRPRRGLRLNVVEQLSMRVSGREPGPEGSVAKLLWADAEQNLQHLAMDIAGADALTGRRPERLESYFRSRPVSVYGGSAQIQKNILALSALGMPRS